MLQFGKCHAIHVIGNVDRQIQGALQPSAHRKTPPGRYVADRENVARIQVDKSWRRDANTKNLSVREDGANVGCIVSHRLCRLNGRRHDPVEKLRFSSNTCPVRSDNIRRIPGSWRCAPMMTNRLSSTPNNIAGRPPFASACPTMRIQCASDNSCTARRSVGRLTWVASCKSARDIGVFSRSRTMKCCSDISFVPNWVLTTLL